ncbi:putative permease [Shimia sp. SK013]|uniref:permease n=1 Tax=Shimia sp. SK013 TaxID=1389006 RepID=UPI0006B3FBEF|nr:permease [Shimia sp. SK013]KPA21451.1 putative permease [Shimia sp. SK013]
MADTTQSPSPLGARLARIDKVWAAVVAILIAVAVLDPPEFVPTVEFALNALLGTLPFILFAVLAIGYLKATGAENLLSNAFEGRETRMIILAALLGGLSPFCSCEVIPFIAALLAVGAPLSAVMAFWLASPLMDPAMFGITAGALGFEFALAKLGFAVSLGLLGGFGTKLMKSTAVFHNPLREKPQVGGCCGVKKPFADKPNWKFWQEPARRDAFREAAMENGAFLLKWLSFAYVIEALMVSYMPAQLIANVLGGDGFQPIFLGALVGMPAYLNGYAAPALVAGLLEQGMANGAAMSFVIAGGVSSIPAAIAVWALVKPRVFAAYIGFALLGALIAGTAWQAIA